MLQLNQNEKSLERYIGAVVAYFADLRMIPRSFFRYPFDFVALELLAKSVSLARSSLVLIGNDQAEEAFGLGRSLVEDRLILRHLTRDKALISVEAWKFLRFSLADKNFWLFHARRVFTDTDVLSDVDRHAEQWNLSGQTPMAATRSWSNKYSAWGSQEEDHPLDGLTNTKSHRSSRFAIDYTQASFFVHCTQPSLDNFFPEEGVPFEIRPSNQRFVDARGISFYQAVTSLHEIVTYVLYGLNLDSPASLNELFREIIRDAAPVERKSGFAED
jgi:hypothetical protein